MVIITVTIIATTGGIIINHVIITTGRTAIQKEESVLMPPVLIILPTGLLMEIIMAVPVLTITGRPEITGAGIITTAEDLITVMVIIITGADLTGTMNKPVLLRVPAA